VAEEQAGTARRDRYRRLDTLGRGGQGVVEKALDTQTDRVVALKVQALGPETDRDAVLDETRVLLALPPHPNVALARSDFFDADSHVLVMDFVDGPSLAARLADAPEHRLAPADALRWLNDVAGALDHLHAQHPPVVHGDIKPANVVIDGARAVLVDFGLARTRTGPPAQATRAYAAPDALAGNASPATDLYSFAATAYALLTGTPPAPGATNDLPDAARAVLARGLAIDPAERPRSARALVGELAAALGVTLPAAADTGGAPAAPRRSRWIAVAAAAVVAIVLLATLLVRDDGPDAASLATATPTTGATTPATTMARAGAATTTTTARVAATNVTSAALPVGRFATVSPDGTIEVRRIFSSGAVEAPRATAAPASSWTVAVQVRPRDVLLYRSNDTSQSAFIDAQGDAEVAHGYVVGANLSLGTGIDDGWLYWYRADGFCGWARLDDGNNFFGGGNAQPDGAAGFDALAYAGARRVLHYDRESGNAWLARVTEGSVLETLARPKLALGLTVLAPTGRDYVVTVGGNGAATVVRVTDSAVTSGQTASVGGGNYTAAAAFAGGTVLLDRDTGQGKVVWVSDDGRVTRVDGFAAPRGALLVAVD
jgi:tRNA A-37 threonylcarbamoyl transferase component Bud32